MIRCFLSISQVYYLIVFNSFKTARLEQITFWKLVLNLMNVFENSFYSDRYPVHFQFTVPLWLILPVKNFPYRFNISISISLSSVFPPSPTLILNFLHDANFFPRFFVLWKHKSIVGKTRHSSFILYSLKVHRFCKALKQKNFESRD